MSASSSVPSSSSSAVIPWGLRTSSSSQQREKQLMFEVLDNPSLREEILKHAIIGGDNKVDQLSACILRRVDKSWNESVLRILWKVQEPLYEVAPADGGNLDAFAKTFAVSSTASGPPSPLKLHRLARLFTRTDLESFSNFMITCGSALLQLGLIIFDFGIPLPFDLPLWSIPHLHKLEIHVALRRQLVLAAGEQPETEIATGHQSIPECLIKCVFLGATVLAELDLSVDGWLGGDPADVTMFDSITFPPTLVKIKFVMELDSHQSRGRVVNALLKSHLPKVTALSFIAWPDVIAEGLLFSIMDKFKTLLKTLVIVAKDYEGPPPQGSTVCFPVMEQLEEFSMSSVTVELASGQRSLETFFPKLRSLRLRFQSPGMLRKWTESSRFPAVTSLELTMADGNFSPDNDPDDYFVSVNMEAMQGVNYAFPNLSKLVLATSKSDPSGLSYVFQEMRQLKELKVKVFGELSESRTSHVWDSILTGVPVEMMASIRGREPGSLENADGLVPITNLQELTSFSVEDDFAIDSREHDLDGISLISDFIFDHGFLEMPRLTHLHFEGPFQVSEEMTKQWTSEQGRSLVYKQFSNSKQWRNFPY